MSDWIETPEGSFINLDKVLVVEEEEDGQIRLYSDDTPRVYSGGRSFYGIEAAYIRDQLRIRTRVTANYFQENAARVKLGRRA